MANYNHGHYLNRSARAILDQIYPNFELVVVDDGSTDNSLEVLASLSREYSNLVVVTHNENKGVVITINTGIDASSGAYISFQSADDYVLPGFISKLMAMALQYPEVGILTSNPITERSGSIYKHNKGYNVSEYIKPEKLSSRLEWRYFWIAGHASIISKKYLLEAGGFHKNLKWFCDWVVLYVIAFRHGVCYVPEGLSVLRVIEGSYSHNVKRSDAQNACQCVLQLLDNEYVDVKPLFQKSALLAMLPGISCALMASKKYYKYFRPIFLFKIMYYQSRKIVGAVFERVKNVITPVKAACHD